MFRAFQTPGILRCARHRLSSEFDSTGRALHRGQIPWAGRSIRGTPHRDKSNSNRLRSRDVTRSSPNIPSLRRYRPDERNPAMDGSRKELTAHSKNYLIGREGGNGVMPKTGNKKSNLNKMLQKKTSQHSPRGTLVVPMKTMQEQISHSKVWLDAPLSAPFAGRDRSVPVIFDPRLI
jgi:hypothetical protein